MSSLLVYFLEFCLMFCLMLRLSLYLSDALPDAPPDTLPCTLPGAFLGVFPSFPSFPYNIVPWKAHYKDRGCYGARVLVMFVFAAVMCHFTNSSFDYVAMSAGCGQFRQVPPGPAKFCQVMPGPVRPSRNKSEQVGTWRNQSDKTRLSLGK